MKLIGFIRDIKRFSLISKISLIHTLTLIVFYFLRKHTIGWDEREYILASFFKDNDHIRIDEFSQAPIFIIRFFKYIIYGFKELSDFEMINYVNDESFTIFKFILLTLLILIPFLIYKISSKFQKLNLKFNLEYIILSISLIVSIPILYGKHLYALISLFSVPLILWISYILIPNYDTKKKVINKINNKTLFIAGILLSIVNLFRFDSITIYLFISAQFLLIFIFGNENKRKNLIKFMIFSLGYLLIFIINTTSYSFHNNVMQPPTMFFTNPYGGTGWVDGPFKYVEQCYSQGNYDYLSILSCIFTQGKFNSIIASLALNIKELSKAIFSIDAFPLFLVFLPCSGFLLMLRDKKFKELFIFNNALILSSLAYTLFAIEIRYTLFASLGLSLYSIFAINNMKKLDNLNPVIRPLLIILFVNSYFYLFFGITTHPHNIFNF
tara:strand:+ start:11755 stop:13071 length:1317 start_codon:yes stop_codon:yes gene_type:complete